MILIRTVLPFGEKKNWHKSMFSFLTILLNCTDWAITGRKARVQFNSTLERKVKTRALKGIFLVRKWINNTLKSNSVRYHMHHWKNLSFLSSFGLRAVFVKGSKIAVFVGIVTSKRARWPPLFITFLSSSWLVTSVHQVSSTIYVGFFYKGITLISLMPPTPFSSAKKKTSLPYWKPAAWKAQVSRPQLFNFYYGLPKVLWNNQLNNLVPDHLDI